MRAGAAFFRVGRAKYLHALSDDGKLMEEGTKEVSKETKFQKKTYRIG
jgi:hypothetical protein